MDIDTDLLEGGHPLAECIHQQQQAAREIAERTRDRQEERTHVYRVWLHREEVCPRG